MRGGRSPTGIGTSRAHALLSTPATPVVLASSAHISATRSLPADFPFSTFSHPRAHRHWLPTNALGKGTYSDFAARSKALARSASLPPHRRATPSVIQSFAACLVCVPTSVFFLIPPRPHASQIGPHSSWRLRLTSLKVFHETFPTSPAHSSVPMATQVNSTPLSYRQIPDCFPYYSRLFFSTGH